MAEMQCCHRNGPAPQKETYNCVCVLNEGHTNYAWETSMLGSLPEMMMGLPGKLLFMVPAVFAVTDSETKCKQETKENLQEDSLQRLQGRRWGKAVHVKEANKKSKRREKETNFLKNEKLKKLRVKQKQELRGEWRMKTLVTENGEKTDSYRKEKMKSNAGKGTGGGKAKVRIAMRKSLGENDGKKVVRTKTEEEIPKFRRAWRAS